MMERWIEAFRGGTKASRGITAAQLAEVAEDDFDANPRGLCFGHPKNDDPAAGRITGAKVEGNSLMVKVTDLADKAIDGIKSGAWLNRSAAFFDPHHEANPRPGKWTLRHVGLLGAAAPGIPGMQPLKQAFSFDADGGLLADGDPADAVIYAPAPTGTAYVFESKEPDLVEAKRRLGKAIALHEKHMNGDAPTTGPAGEKSQVTMMVEMKAALAALEGATPAAEESKMKMFSAQEPTPMADLTPEQIAENDRLTKLAAELDKREQEFAAASDRSFQAGNTSLIDSLVAAGKVLPAEAPALKLAFNALGRGELEFGAADKPDKATPAAKLAGFLSTALPKRVPVNGGRTSPTGEFEAVEYATPAAFNAAAEQLAKDKGLTFEAAAEELAG